MELRRRCAFRNAKQFSDFLMRFAFQCDEVEDGSVSVGKALDHLLDFRRRDVSDVGFCVVGDVWEMVLELDKVTSFLPAEIHKCFIDSDSAYPCLEGAFSFGFEGSDGREDFHEAVLEDVFGDFFVGDVACAYGEEISGPAVVHLFHGFLTAVPDIFYEPLVGCSAYVRQFQHVIFTVLRNFGNLSMITFGISAANLLPNFRKTTYRILGNLFGLYLFSKTFS